MFHFNCNLIYSIEIIFFCLTQFLFCSILEHEPGETVPLVVRQTIDYIKNNGK